MCEGMWHFSDFEDNNVKNISFYLRNRNPKGEGDLKGEGRNQEKRIKWGVGRQGKYPTLSWRKKSPSCGIPGKINQSDTFSICQVTWHPKFENFPLESALSYDIFKRNRLVSLSFWPITSSKMLKPDFWFVKNLKLLNGFVENVIYMAPWVRFSNPP